MENKNEKKGIFNMLKGMKKDKKSSCCCGFQIEEISDESTDSKNTKEKKSCCD